MINKPIFTRVNEAHIDGPNGEDRELSEDQVRLVASGRADTTTMAYVTITVYTSASFRFLYNYFFNS